MALDLKEHRPAHFDFSSQALRDEAIRRVNNAVAAYLARVKSQESLSPPPMSASLPELKSPTSPHHLSTSPTGTSTFKSNDYISSPSTSSTFTARLSSPERSLSISASLAPGANASSVLVPTHFAQHHVTSKTVSHNVLPLLPKVINLPRNLLPRIAKNGKYKHVVCLTIGSRGDVQPYIALALGLMELGHRVTIVTHAEYKEWIEGKGVKHRTAGGDPGALMKLSVEHKMFSPQFFKESLTNVSAYSVAVFNALLTSLQFRSWLDECKLTLTENRIARSCDFSSADGCLVRMCGRRYPSRKSFSYGWRTYS